ncbi:MAG: TonB-dependent receptor plug domain-containing protein, partial [Sinomicrobium sp.]|nr:TonB-dependent receptor plug domain-containing protein [Sinomicrobium sp.]
GKNEKGGLFITSGDAHSDGYSGHSIHIRKHAGHDIDTDDDADVIIIEKGGKGEKKRVHKIKKTIEADGDIEEYLDGDNVVIVEKTGKDKKKKMHKIKVGNSGSKGGGVVFSGDDDSDPLVLIDGKESTKKQAEAMDPETIEKIEVLKGESATEKYGKKAKDGVVLITTNKKED